MTDPCPHCHWPQSIDGVAAYGAVELMRKELFELQKKLVEEREAAKGLFEAVHFLGQTIHQAYHETGTYKECSKNTCDAATQALAAYKARTEGK